jgi:ABC-type transporter Mla maintaining outer membrane lipid asymmetry permease subunit MlaE
VTVASLFALTRAMARELQQSLDSAAKRLHKTWWTNPRVLVTFGLRLGGAVFAVGVRPRFPSLITLGRQIFRTFFRGIAPVVVLAFAVGLGLGAVADRFGVLLLPLVEQTFVLAMVRDGMPLILALLLTARSGASVATRLGDDRQTSFRTGRADARELLTTSLPHLLAGAVTGWVYSRLASALVVAGYHSRGNPWDLVDDFLASISAPLDPELPLDRVLGEASVKTALFGFIVAYVACGLGIAANEKGRNLPTEERAVELQDAVWESGVTAVIMCLLAAIAWWNIRGTVN